MNQISLCACLRWPPGSTIGGYGALQQCRDGLNLDMFLYPLRLKMPVSSVLSARKRHTADGSVADSLVGRP